MTAYDKVKKAILSGVTLSGVVALKEFGIVQNTFVYYMHKLRKEGYKVKGVRKPSLSGNYYTEYHLPVRERKAYA